MNREEIQKAISDPEWQRFRESLKGLSTASKLRELDIYIRNHTRDPLARIRVQNYKNALKRAGLL